MGVTVPVWRYISVLRWRPADEVPCSLILFGIGTSGDNEVFGNTRRSGIADDGGSVYDLQFARIDTFGIIRRNQIVIAFSDHAQIFVREGFLSAVINAAALVPAVRFAGADVEICRVRLLQPVVNAADAAPDHCDLRGVEPVVRTACIGIGDPVSLVSRSVRNVYCVLRRNLQGYIFFDRIILRFDGIYAVHGAMPLWFTLSS